MLNRERLHPVGFCFLLVWLLASGNTSRSFADSPNAGRIVAWGRNISGQCNVPIPVTGFKAIAAGGQYSVALKSDGSIIAWGRNTFGECDIPSPNSNFVAIAARNLHTLGLKADGSIVAWGMNSGGQCDVPLPNTDFVGIAAGGGTVSPSSRTVPWLLGETIAMVNAMYHPALLLSR